MKEFDKNYDILEKAKERRFIKTLKRFDIIIIITMFAAMVSLAFGCVSLLFGWQDEFYEFLRQILAVTLTHAVIYGGVIVCEVIASQSWRRKSQRDDWKIKERVIKCTPVVYVLPIIGVLLLLMMGLLFYNITLEEGIEFWEEGVLTFPLLFLLGYNIVAVVNFLYYTRQRVYYSRYGFKMVSFGKSCDIPWSQVRTIVFSSSKKKKRLTVTAAEMTIVLRSEVLADGWDDFVVWSQQMAREYGFSFGENRM